MRSSFCRFGDCVEVQFTNGRVYVSSEDRTISFTHEEWAAFLAGVRAGEFDMPEEER